MKFSLLTAFLRCSLAAKLARGLWMPLVSRDEIKEGYVNTFGVRHDQLPPDTNRMVTDLFSASSRSIWRPKSPS